MVLLKLALQRIARDVENSRGFAFVVFHASENGLDIDFFDFIKGEKILAAQNGPRFRQRLICQGVERNANS